MSTKTAPETLFGESTPPRQDNRIEVVLEPAPVLTREDIPPVMDHQPAMMPPAYLWTVTPEMAAWLISEHDRLVEQAKLMHVARDGHNRNIRMRDTTTYGRDMTNDNWKGRNGETLKRTWDGFWSDGQHRLMACMDAKVAIESYIVFGTNLEDQDTVDTGIKRKLHDQLNLRGEPNARHLEAVSRWAWKWLRGVRSPSTAAGTNPSELELIEFIQADERLRIATNWGVRAYQQFRYVRVSVYGMAWLLFYGIDALSAEVFLNGVMTGADLSANHPALTYRERMTDAYIRRERLNQHEQLALMISAWNAFRAERKLVKVQLPAGGLKPGNFPEPR